MALNIHTQCSFNKYTAHSLYRIMVMTTSVVGVMKMRNIVPRAGLEPTSLACRSSMLPLHQIGFLPSVLNPHPPVYVTLCLRGQCPLLHNILYVMHLAMEPVVWVIQNNEIISLELHLNPHLGLSMRTVRTMKVVQTSLS